MISGQRYPQGRDKPFGILYIKGASVIRSLAARSATTR